MTRAEILQDRDDFTHLIWAARRSLKVKPENTQNCFYFQGRVRKEGVHDGLYGNFRNLQGDTTFIWGCASTDLKGTFTKDHSGDISEWNTLTSQT